MVVQSEGESETRLLCTSIGRQTFSFDLRGDFVNNPRRRRETVRSKIHSLITARGRRNVNKRARRSVRRRCRNAPVKQQPRATREPIILFDGNRVGTVLALRRYVTTAHRDRVSWQFRGRVLVSRP